jgi:probable aminopeptidase NPEPL1
MLVIAGQLPALRDAVSALSLDLDAPLQSITNEDKGGVARSFVTLESGVYLQVALCALPMRATRMNNAARPDVLAQRVAELIPKSKPAALLVCPTEDEHVEALASAVSRGLPSLNRKSGEASKQVATDVFFFELTDEVRLGRLESLMQGVSHAAAWVDAPPEELNVPEMVEAAREIAVRVGAEIDVFEGEQLMHMGAGGLWNVGRAALHLPAMVILRGPRSAPDAPQMVWVGKGIMYDTGGLSLKPKGSMGGMKMDMGGAAAVLGAFEVAASRGEATDLCAVLCLAENAIGPKSIRNDDIITMYSGKTVEINNTDAEGRLVLGDGVAYATQQLSASVVVDVATLTGAQLVATGRTFAAIVSNDEELERATVAAGKESGDLVHPLPYCPELLAGEFKSVVADMKNSVKDRLNAQSSCAGHFVESHITDSSALWLHIDIAGPAFIKERGTGYGVSLLSNLAIRWQRGTLGS